ncbi:ABC transporter permease [Neorhizobium sp. P12A]|jgi:inositol transport system permease protein|uniref:ABC transporter permease n=1 Tax=Rhizobium/Agrobacterium group TaxID=227290 RepID=UPI0010500A74|nr:MULTISPECIES: ABC transporter permease [Rhizobium/Agrobacterium group]KAA0698849.1 ABC transporter permease [Neorhizobium sp. P12A]TCR90167.1 monosaccharide ABC transporter membrane protein (CUT2 family) [Rhizobium sp. BK376]
MATKIAEAAAPVASPMQRRRRRIPPEISILMVLVGIALIFEILGWIFIGQSFLFNSQRLTIMVLQVAVIGIIAVGVTQVIITGGIDLSSGSVVGMTAMIAASFAQASTWPRALYPGLTDLPFFIPIGVGLLIGLAAGIVNGQLIARTGIPPFIATLGMMVSARGVAKWYTKGQPVSGLTDQFNFIGTGIWPVIVFLVVALIFHIALRYTRYGKFTYAIGANVQAARVSGINIESHLVKVYAIAGLLAGLAGVVTAARAQTAQAGMGVMYELDAIAATVIGGTSLTGGVGRITGTVIGTVILGVMTSGFTFLRVDAYYQEIVKGLIIVAAVVVDVYRQKKRVKH